MKNLLISLLVIVSGNVFAQSSIRIDNIEVDKSNLEKSKVTLKSDRLVEQNDLGFVFITKPRLVFDRPVIGEQSEFYPRLRSINSGIAHWICKKFGYKQALGVVGDYLENSGIDWTKEPTLAASFDEETGKFDVRITSKGTTSYYFYAIRDTVKCSM